MGQWTHLHLESLHGKLYPSVYMKTNSALLCHKKRIHIKLNPPNWYKKQTGHRSDSERDTKLQEWLKNNMPCLFLVIYIKNNNNCYNDLCREFVFLCNFASTYIILQYFALLNMTISFWCFFFHTSYLFVVFCSHFFLFYSSFYCILLWSFFTSE